MVYIFLLLLMYAYFIYAYQLYEYGQVDVYTYSMAFFILPLIWGFLVFMSLFVTIFGILMYLYEVLTYPIKMYINLRKE